MSDCDEGMVNGFSTRPDCTSTFVWKTTKDSKTLTWNVDGEVVDNTGVGEAVFHMDGLHADLRPKTIVSMITSQSINQGHAQDNVRHLFRPKIKWIQNWDADRKMSERVVCKLRDQMVWNPNHLFELGPNSQNYQASQAGKVQKNCTAEDLLSKTPDELCGNLKYWVERTGCFYIRDAGVVANQFWGIQGGWSLTLIFNWLMKSVAAQKWVNEIFTADEQEAEREKLKHFPFFGDETFWDPHLEGIGIFAAFTLMNFNAFRGYMTYCVAMAYKTQGAMLCPFCKERLHNELCTGWLPRFSDKMPDTPDIVWHYGSTYEY